MVIPAGEGCVASLFKFLDDELANGAGIAPGPIVTLELVATELVFIYLLCLVLIFVLLPLKNIK